MSVRRSMVLGFAVAVLLAGCQGDPEPKVDPTPSGSSSETSPSDQPQPQTARQFVRAWVDTYNDFEASGDATAFAALNKDCSTCDDIQQTVESAYASGGFLKSQGWQILGNVSGAPPTLTAVIDVSPSRFKPSADGDVERSQGGRITVEFRVRKHNDGWRVTDLIQRPA
jgi:hypothetical protein